MKKIIKIFTILIILTTLSACSCSKQTTTKPASPLMFGSVVRVKNFDIDLVNYEVMDAATPTEKYPKLVYVSVNLTNIGNGTLSFDDEGVYRAYGPDNIQLLRLISKSYPTLLRNLGPIRRGGTTSGHIIIPFVGYGEYYIEFNCPQKNSDGKTVNTIRTFKFIVRE